ncbi:MAG: hypothetical protein QOJ51_2683 [Acidobacteriaceae bacterium]|nr:hypothetical protein [Acidobacteriaceae bacterium]
MPGQRGWEPDEPVETPSGLVAPGQPRGVAMSEVVRPAIEADDLLRAVATLCHGAHGEEPAYARKMVELLVDGLRYGAGTRIDTPRNRRR